MTERAINRAEIDVDATTMARVVESVVTKGDISGLAPADKARLYIQTCESLGLNPATQPLAPLKLNNKEILYPTRGATDQLAAIHRLTREIIDGPKVVDICGTKMGYCVAKATHPNGRTETAIATVPAGDPAMLYMKLETKAKRRVTLSILGLGWLDETEVDAIPASAKAPGQPIDLSAGAEPVDHPALAELRDRLTQDGVVPSVDALVQAYDETVGALGADDGAAKAAGLRACYAHLEEVLEQRGQRVRLKAAIDAREKARAQAKRAAAELPPIDQAEADMRAARSTDELTAIAADVASLRLAKGSPGQRRLAAAYREAVARIAGTPPPEPPRGGGGGAPAPADAAPGEEPRGDDPERAAIVGEGGAAAARSLDAFAAYLATKATVTEVANGVAAHLGDYDGDEWALMRVAVARIQALAPDMGGGVAANHCRIAINARARKRGAARAARAGLPPVRVAS